ncbi:MAG: MATE family efflux transporter [Bacteroidales bacterium]|nr:MATE family efflux transporter [Bacteroidales bacterium]
MKTSINRDILKLAIPNILTNLTIPLLGIVDLALMGHLGHEAYIGALALGATVFSLLYSGLIFLRMGTTGFTAQSYGAKHFREAINWLGRGIVLALFLGLVLISFQKPIKYLVFMLIDGSEQVMSLTAEYFNYRIWAAPASLGVFVFTGWFLGMQNAKIPLTIALIINVVNIIFSVYFVRFANMGIQGVALGTVLAQYSGFVASAVFLLIYYKRMVLMLSAKLVFHIKSIKRYLKTNVDILIRSLLITGTFFYFNVLSAEVNDLVLSVNSVLLQFLWIFAYFIDGFAFAAESLTGKYVGAKNKADLKSLIRLLLIWGVGLSISFSLLNLALGKQFIALLTDNILVIDNAQTWFFWVIIIPIIGFLAFMMDGVYIGATATKPMRNVMLVSVLLVFLPAQYFLLPLWGNNGLWLALILFLLSRGVLLWAFHKPAIYKTEFD